MVQSVESPADSFSLFQLGGAGRTPWAKSADGAVFGMTSRSGEGSDALPATSGDYATAFQRLSAGLQTQMVQLQSIAGSGGTSSDPPTGGGGAIFHASHGNRALQGDADAMVNDLHGFVQVASGDALAESQAAPVTPATPIVPAVSSAQVVPSANDNVGPSASGPPDSGGLPTTAGTVDLSGSSASADVSGSTLGLATFGYAPTMMQAAQNYGAANAACNSPHSTAAVSAVG